MATPNDYYNAGQLPQVDTLADAGAMAARFEAIANGFNRLPDELDIKGGRTWFGDDTSVTANALDIHLADDLRDGWPSGMSYPDGFIVRFRPNFRNTGAVTISVTGGPRVALRSPGSNDPLTGGELDPRFITWAEYSSSTLFFHIARRSPYDIQALTQSQYDNLGTYQDDTLYLIIG